MSAPTFLDLAASIDPVLNRNINWPRREVGSGGTNVLSTDNIVEFDCTSGVATATLPDAATVKRGMIFALKKIDPSGNAVTVQGTGGQTIDGQVTRTLSAQYDVLVVYSDGANYKIYSSLLASTTVPDYAFVQRVDVAVDSDELLISGLNGDVDECYDIFLAILNNSATSGMSVGMQANSLANGDTTYNDQHLIGTGALALAGRDLGINRISRNNAAGAWSFTKILLFAKSGIPRAAIATDMSPDASIVNSQYSWGWMDTATNLASLKFLPSIDDATPIADSVGAGSYAVVYKRRMR